MRALGQADIVLAFVEQSQSTGHVALAKRGNGPNGYVNVFGPSHDPEKAQTARIVIEHDGAVSFKDEDVASALGASPRNTGTTAPGMGAAKWELSGQAIAATYGGADEHVAAIVTAMKAHASW